MIRRRFWACFWPFTSIGVGAPRAPPQRHSFARSARRIRLEARVPHAYAMAAMSAVAPVRLRASAPATRKSRAGRMSARVVAPAALRGSAVTGRRTQGMSVRPGTTLHRSHGVRDAKPRGELTKPEASRPTIAASQSRVVIGAGYRKRRYVGSRFCFWQKRECFGVFWRRDETRRFWRRLADKTSLTPNRRFARTP